jgi:hypothetical protein
VRYGVLVLCVAAGSGAVALAHGTYARASSATGCEGLYYPGNSCTLPYLVALTASISYDEAGTHRVCAAAETSTGGFYAHWVCATGYAEHCYDGSNSLYADVGSGDSNVYTGFGEEFWNVGCP